MTPHHMDVLRDAGVDFFTGGNHTFKRPALFERLENSDWPVVGPANAIGEDNPKTDYKIVHTNTGDVAVVSLLGSVFPEDLAISSPLQKIDEILARVDTSTLAAFVVNIHSDYSSEKVMAGHYLDGRVTMVVGDHWHVPTNDARILPKGTAHMSDVGMCGSLNSSLGIELSSTIPRWYDGSASKKVMAEDRPYQLNGLLVKNTTATGAEAVQVIRKIVN
jgi:calcineurin-like phosphoesterase